MPTPKLSPIAAASDLPEHLFRRANGMFYARVRLPRSAGKGDHLQESLKTKDEREARRRLPHVAAKLLAERERLSRSPEGALRVRPSAPPREAAKWADWWRQRVVEKGGNPDKGDIPLPLEIELEREIERRRGPQIGEEVDDLEGPYPVYDATAERDALELADVAQGRRQPIGAELERFLSEARTRVRTKSRTRLAVKRLVDWRRKRTGGDSLRTVSRMEAGLFVDHLLAEGLTTATANSMVTALSSYWRWMEKRGVTEGNPWREQGRQRTEAEEERGVRAFTDDEATKLLSGTTTRTLHDLMRMAALTGARINALACLEVRDTVDDVFNIRRDKTPTGVRKVPIHSQLKALVARRTAGKAPNDFLFDELKAPASRPDERSAKASERFTEYRRSMGVDERAEGQRNSNVDFHSWRHRFTTEALRAGHLPHIVSAVVGHKVGRESVTLAVYDKAGPSIEQKRAVIESVSLPKGVPIESPEGPLMNRLREGVERVVR